MLEAGDVHVAVGTAVRAHREERRVVVALLRRHLTVGEPAAGLEVHEVDHRLEQRRVHPLPATRALAREQRREHTLGEEGARRGVADRDADAPRAGSGRAGHRHHAAHPLGHLVESTALGVGTVLPESREAGVDEARVAREEHFGPDAEPVLHARAKVLDEHVGAVGEREERAESRR